MKNFVFVSIVLLSFAFPAQSQDAPVMQKTASGDEIHIDFYSAYKNRSPILLTSQIADDIEFIPLETKDECLIGDFIRNIVVTQKDIIIFDYDGCYRFNRQGKFLNQIGTKGNGPGEYTQPMSIMTDTLNNWIYFLDPNSSRLVKYDFAGKYIKDLKIDGLGYKGNLYRPEEFVIEHSFYQYAKRGERYSSFYYSETNKKVISKMKCDYDKDIPRLAMCAPMSYLYKDNMYIKDFWSDTIYKMRNPYQLESYAIIDKGKFEHRTRDDKSLITGKEETYDHLVLGIGGILETDRFMFISSNKGLVIYDKYKQVSFCGGEDPSIAPKDDLYGGSGLKNYFVNGNDLYTYGFAYEFIENGDGKHSITDARYDAYRKMVDGLDEEDNPVIMIVKIKR